MSFGRALLAVCLLRAGSVGAHDYWLLPDPLRVAPGGRVALSLWVGDDFVPDEARGWQPERTPRFVHLTARSTADLRALATADARPLVALPLAVSGGHLFAMERNVARIELPAERFERYLRDEGLGAVVEARRARGENAAPGRERYTRYLKAFAQVGGRRDDVSTRALGQTLELIPADDLARVRPGQALRVAVHFRGAPLGGVLVEALSRVGDDVRRVGAVSDVHGAVTFAVDREGTWLLRAVHMARCEGCADADWESWWTSYTFGVCAPRERVCAAAPMTLRAASATTTPRAPIGAPTLAPRTGEPAP
jgi:hypothetical protein